MEIALILGIVLGALKKFERTDLYSSVWLGLFSAAAASLVLAALVQGLGSSLEGRQEEIFEGAVMLLAGLFGYNGNPSLSEVVAYIGFFLAISWGLRWVIIKSV
jgi:high-affinity Fe2+/Pb2+ permease